MKFKLVTSSTIHESQLVHEELSPAYRKATKNMLAADYVCKDVLSNFTQEDKRNLGFILGTRFGEISSTLEFLSAYEQEKPLSPIHFQNSLHNSTLGFICINQQLTGPALTISVGEKTEDALIDSAAAIGSMVPYVLLCTIDFIPENFKESYYAAYLELKKNDGWAKAYLLQSNFGTETFNLKSTLK